MSITEEDGGIFHLSEESHPLSWYSYQPPLDGLKEILYGYHGNLVSQTLQVCLNYI